LLNVAKENASKKITYFSSEMGPSEHPFQGV